MLLGQLFNLEARAVTVAIHRAEDDIRTAQTSLQTVDSIPQVTAVIVKLPTAPLNKGTVERFHPLYPANDKHALATKLKGRTPLIARAVPTAAGRGAGSSETCFIFPGRGGFFPFACLPCNRFTLFPGGRDQNGRAGMTALFVLAHGCSPCSAYTLTPSQQGYLSLVERDCQDY